ncbi:MAG: glycoside hydrolase [Phycisphaerae bacterium]|nr:glycoside hydrolase [Opitutae bacterium]MBI68424.1 glycoside hydrolase [Phycisphaerae bacterium]|tara:strand:+ start:1322 stop:2458 length:1137 start_codon:yes stop_codon:yes gene_type:complete
MKKLLIALSMVLSLTVASRVLAADKLPPTPFSTKGAKIVDAKGAPVLVRGVSWFGMETETHVPHGLWARGYKETLQHISEMGFNLIRLPFSLNALRSRKISGIDFNKGSNRDFQGKTPLQAMDLVIEEARRRNLLILLDFHRLNDREIPELWYGDGYTEKDWIDTWLMLAKRYRKQANVIGADIKNEPHGRASWGTGDLKTDWRLAAERAGNAIHKVNPDWLIVVEGIDKNVPGQKLPGHWWGGNLEGVRKFPVRLKVPRKLVYSPHEYGTGVHHAKWFDDPKFPNNLRYRWETGFHYIAREGIAPVLVGEFGGRKVDAKSKEGIWQRHFVAYLKEKELGFIYWCWNPNGGDTGGLVKDDWKTEETHKVRLLQSLLGK